MSRSGIPLRIRLSLGSAARLTLAIAAFGIIAYQTSKRVALEAAASRARSSVFNLAERSGLGLQEILRPLIEVARDPAIIEALRSGSPTPAAELALARLPVDSGQTVGVGIRTQSGRIVQSLKSVPPTWAFDESLAPDSAGLGRLRVQGDSLLYELAAPVFDGDRLLGSVVRVRRVTTTPNSVRVVSDLLGEDGALLFGNRDGSLWTDLTTGVQGPEVGATRYTKDGKHLIVATREIPGTPYVFAAEFSEEVVLAPVRTLIWDFALIGIVLVGLGLGAGWWATGRVTRPLSQLTQAAEAITAGSRPNRSATEERGDELERLQRAFYTMSESVQESREALEQQVRDRSQALEEQKQISEALKLSEDRLSAERSRLEEALKDLQASEEALRLADRRKNDFLATLAHELRNPLAPIRNAIHIFKVKNSADPELRWGRDVIDRQVSQMTRLLDDLLDVSRISHNRLELRLQRVDLGAVLTNAAETSRPLIDGAGHHLTMTVPEEPVLLEADPVRLAQIFSNLLNNSAKYTPPGGRICVVAERVGKEIVVTVTDDGIGINPDALPHVFEMFTQARPGFDQLRGGLGIGLSLVQGLVGLHGGAVSASSEGEGYGSRFTVRLPLVQPKPIFGLLPSGNSAETRSPVSRRLLIADDLEDSVESLATLLRLMGHEVWTANDGAAALAVAERNRPEIVLMDLGMPKVDGYEACRRIREQPWGKHVVMIALTGWGQDEDRRRTEAAGFDYHFVKPVDPGVLVKLLDSPLVETQTGRL